MNIRSAQETDLNQIYMMGFDVWSGNATVEEYLNSCRDSKKYSQGRWMILEKDGALLSSLIIYDLNREWAGIGSIATPKELRRQGFAAELISGVIKQLQSSSELSTVFLFSDINPAYYNRFGFEALEAKYQSNSDAVLMGLSFTETPAWVAEDFIPPTYF